MRIALVALVVLLPLVAIVWSQQRRLIYFPFGAVPDPGAVGLEGATPVTLSDGRRAHAERVVREPHGQRRISRVIVFNGNAGNRAHFALRWPTRLRAPNLAVLLFDYRGYGGNPGSPTEAGLTA